MTDISSHVRIFGYAFMPSWHGRRETIETARSVGTVASIAMSRRRTVQTLVPQRANKSEENRYSGVFGLSEFPLHTDLAHWARPPRYILLRCKKGSSAVATTLLSDSALLSMFGHDFLQRALFCGKRNKTRGACCLLPLPFRIGDT